MPDLVRPKDVIAQLHKLGEREVCEMYSRLFQRAMETNPLRSWQLKMNPTVDDLKEILEVLPPSDMSQIQDIYF